MGKSCLTNAVAFCDGMTGLEDKEWVLFSIVLLVFSQVLKTTPHPYKPIKYVLGKGMFSENCSSCTDGHKGLQSAAQIPAGSWSIVEYSQSI